MLICISVRGVRAGEQYGVGEGVRTHMVGTVPTLLWAERGSPRLTPILTSLALPPPARMGQPPWPLRTSHDRVESITDLFAEWITLRTGSRRKGLWASSREGWPIPLDTSEKENKRMKSFSISSYIWETSDAYCPVFLIRNITGCSAMSFERCE